MTRMAMGLAAVVLVVAMVQAGETATAPLSAPSVDCSTVISNMTDCVEFVTVGSKVTKPSDSCCSGLGMVVNYSPSCLCDGLKLASKAGISLDMARAASLPGACNVKVPSMGDCEASGGPSPSPSPSPSPGPSPAPIVPLPSPSPPTPIPPATPVSPSEPPAPSPPDDKAGGRALKSSVFLLIISIAMALWSSLSY